MSAPSLIAICDQCRRFGHVMPWGPGRTPICLRCALRPELELGVRRLMVIDQAERRHDRWVLLEGETVVEINTLPPVGVVRLVQCLLPRSTGFRDERGYGVAIGDKVMSEGHLTPRDATLEAIAQAIEDGKAEMSRQEV
jgi:hypothetical protein